MMTPTNPDVAPIVETFGPQTRAKWDARVTELIDLGVAATVAEHQAMQEVIGLAESDAMYGRPPDADDEDEDHRD